MAHLGAPLTSAIVGAADRTDVPSRRHTGAEGGLELALGDRVWLREGERYVLLLRGSLGSEDDEGGQRRRGVSGWRRLCHLGAVDDFVGRLTTLYDLAVQDVGDDFHVQQVWPVRPTAVGRAYRHALGVG